MAGLQHCRWAPTNRHILTVSDYKVRLTVWSLSDKSVQYISNPKQDNRAIDFSPNNKFMALAERSQESQDIVGIYDITQSTWNCLYHFKIDTFDLEDLKFSRDGHHLIIWDSPLKCCIMIFEIQFNGS